MFQARCFVRFATVFGIAALVGAHAGAQPVREPQRPVKVVVAFAPGGNNDVPVRIVSAKLSELLGVAVNVDNRAGAGGIIGSTYVARSPADGLTLLNCNSATHGVNPALNKTLPYDAVKDFAPISLIGLAPNVLLVPTGSAIRTPREFIAYAKANPGRLSVATAGIGSTQHFSLELMKSMASLDLVHVPYKGGAPALTDLIGGQVPAAITGLPTALAAIQAGKVRALAVTGAQRAKHLPELPTLAESGLPGYEVTSWTGLCAPAGTPQAIVAHWSAAVLRALGSPETHQQLFDAGVEPRHLQADQFAALIASEVARFATIVESARIVVE